MVFRRRLSILFVLTAAATAVVWARVLVLQVVSGDEARRRADAATRRTEAVLGRRGSILDATGEPLAHDRSVPRLVFVPAEWATRERFRCARCAAVLFAAAPRHFDRAGRDVVPPRGCSCGAKRGELAPMPDEDLEPLETALHLPPGTLAADAEERMERLRRKIASRAANRVLGLGRSETVQEVARVRARETAARLGTSLERGRDAATDAVLAELAPELEEHAFEAEDVRSEERTDYYGRPVTLTRFPGADGAALFVRRLPEAAERLLERDRDGRYRGFRSVSARERWYPRHGLLAQVIGLTSPFGRKDEYDAFVARFGEGSVLPDSRIGKTGLEARYDEQLRGEPGLVERRRDPSGAFSEVRVVRAPKKGVDLTLYASARACEEAHRIIAESATQDGYAGTGAASGAIVVLDARTAHVLALGETPVFDLDGNLDEVTDRLDDGDGGTKDVVAAEASPTPSRPDPDFFAPAAAKPGLLLSRAMRIPVQPGSAMKPLTALALLHSTHALPTAYRCAGRRRGPLDVPGCHAGHEGDDVDVVEMLRISCNRFCADCAGDRRYANEHRTLFPAWAASCGFGRPTEVDVSESAGDYASDAPPERLRQLSIGQGMTATPLQMARFMCLLADGRRLPFPRLVAKVGDVAAPDGAAEVVIDPGALAKVREGMRRCVTSGTAAKAFDDAKGLDGVTVYGKTGSARADRGDWEAEPPDPSEPPDPLHPRGPWHLWFVGYATKAGTDPIAFAVVLHARVDGAGGAYAAPAARRFLAWWYSR